MSTDILYTLVLAGCFLALFALAELLYHKFSVKAEYTRKLVHVGTGLLTLLFPVLLHNQWLVLFLCSSFAAMLLISLRYNFLRSINGIDRRSHGSISYPIAVYGCYLVYDHYARTEGAMSPPYIFFYLPILTLAICDPVAALAGKRFPYGKYRIGRDNKTLVGSLSFFVVSLVLTWSLFLLLAPSQPVTSGMLASAVMIAGTAAVAEAVSGRGLDNITIPASVLLVLTLFT